MKHEGSLLCAQKPFTSPYLSQINSLYTTQSYLLRSILILSTKLCLVNNVLEIIWKEAVVLWSKYYFAISLEGLRKNLSQYSQCSGRYSWYKSR
jgi:hypothetical protein